MKDTGFASDANEDIGLLAPFCLLLLLLLVLLFPMAAEGHHVVTVLIIMKRAHSAALPRAGAFSAFEKVVSRTSSILTSRSAALASNHESISSSLNAMRFAPSLIGCTNLRARIKRQRCGLEYGMPLTGFNSSMLSSFMLHS